MRCRAGHLALAGGLALALAACAPAAADVLWADQGAGTISRATADGRVDRALVTGAQAPRAVAVDADHVYWAHGGATGRIGRARLDGSAVDQAFLSVGARPAGVAVSNNAVYWSHSIFGAGQVGRAGLDGSRLTPAFVPIGGSPCGVAIDPDKLYWGNGGRTSVGRSHGQSDVNQLFVRRLGGPCGVAVTDTHVYWADGAAHAIGRARLDGTGVQRRFVPAFRPCGVAVDGRHVYWSTGRGTIGRATRGGRRADQRFVRRAPGACGIAVDPTVRAVPGRHRFRRVRVGGRSIHSFLLRNTSSSPLAVSRIRIVGPGRRHFVETGDSCTVNVVPAGGGCVFNLAFAPTAPGARRASVRIAGSASNMPISVALRGETAP